MDASLIVPLATTPAQALRCLSSLAAVPDDPAHEVVLVDDASPGMEDLLARVEGDAEVVRRPQRGGLAAALRDGLARAQGDAVVLLRDAPEVDPTFLKHLLEALGEPGVALATAGNEDPVLARALAWRRADLHPAAPLPDVPDALVAGLLASRLARRGELRPAPRAGVHAIQRFAGARGHLGEDVELTVVIPTLDATSERVRRCVASIQAATDAPHDIVVVDNGAPPQGFSAPVNAGLRAARGPYAVVCNDDVEVLAGWWPPLKAALDAGAPIAFPRTVKGATREDFAAWCFAVSRAALDEHAVAPGEFLHPELRVWYQDTDLLQRLRVAGTPPVHVLDSHIVHGLSETVLSEDPQLHAWIDQQVTRDKRLFEQLHGTEVEGAGR